MWRFAWAAGLTLAASAAAGPARAQLDSREAIALQNQILELRRDLAARGAVGTGSSEILSGATRPAPSYAGGNDLVPQLLDRVGALEADVRRLHGQHDELANAAQRRLDDLQKRLEDMEFKQGQGPAAGGPAAGGPSTRQPSVTSPQPSTLGTLPSAAPSGPPAGAQVRRTPEIALQEGQSALASRDYPRAETVAREVLAGNRTSPRAYDAQFLLAQSLLGKRDYPQAAIAYDDAYNRNRAGTRAPDSLLGLASALAAINEKKSACETLAKLNTEFPRTRADIRDAAAAARNRNGCR